jgi:tryptophanyl-tRNA synthetase
MGWLERMTQFKDRSRKLSSERIGSGLFSYPVLMAADILLYQTDLVPVGEDQRQHLELTRNLALRVNRILGDTFVIPKAKIGQVGARVMALDDPTSKMSKSADSEAGRIGLLDPPDRVRAKFRRATTDSGTAVDLESPSPGVQNLLEIYRSLTGAGDRELADAFQGKGYGRLKEVVAEVVIEALEPIQRRCHDLLKDPGSLDRLLADGAARARASAAATMATVRQRLGMLPAG